ncbi:hypothetical protein [Paracraurococcus ruber]|uniref:Lipoprotein n=1 Tax=Paracraurococcus ruber TaxID=77675 RepID=A0ABS1D0F6_9PROT|nr:hypothetical protein [Paracraurococcus ruber]MBK1660003.1 hypothetical protein [Paracraurococcus ruber]TDG28715.1 hypothetical protein E2C05_19910 [Paracraurococcus ruber]
MLVQGCATVTSGTTHSMAVLTEPPGAVCQVKRDWQVIGVVNPTPGTISISKSSRDLAIDCSRQGNQPGASVVPAEFQAMTLGNILLGGVIGLAVDAASGALGAYPANVTVVLAPAQFDGLTERDRFYANRADDIRRSFGDRIDTVRRNCTPGAPAVCADSIKLLESQRDDELRQLDSLRLAAPVRGA